MSTARLSARTLQLMGLTRDQVLALQSAAAPVIASAPATYTWISNDAGATWLTTSPQTLTATFRRGNKEIATRTISASRNDGTGAVTLTDSSHAGEPTTVTFSGNATSIASAVIVHDLSQARTYVVFQTLKDGTALGTYSGGGGGPSK